MYTGAIEVAQLYTGATLMWLLVYHPLPVLFIAEVGLHEVKMSDVIRVIIDFDLRLPIY